MNWYSEEDKLLRRYLLDDLTAEERRSVEDRLLSSDESTASVDEDEPDFVDRLLLAEDELIDDYVLGGLSEHERGLFDSGFAIASERKEKLSLANEVMAYAAADPELTEQISISQSKKDTWWRKLFFPEWKMIAYASLALVLGITAWRVSLSESDYVKAKAQIRQIYSSERPLEVRISGYEYARFPKTLGSTPKEKEYVALDRAERLLLDEMTEHPTVETHHELGRLYLARQKFDEAKSILGLAIRAAPNDARLHSDLGATFFELWDRQRSIGQTAESDSLKQRSIDHLTKALTLDGSLHEARFNLALLYQASNQTQLAREEWDKYLRDDPNSSWAKEAEHNLKLLR